METQHKRDGKHATPCVVCGVGTYRADGYCRRCETERGFHPAEMSEAMLMRCAEELMRRHSERAAALSKLGLMRAA